MVESRRCGGLYTGEVIGLGAKVSHTYYLLLFFTRSTARRKTQGQVAGKDDGGRGGRLTHFEVID